MFVGHYAGAFVAKAVEPRMSLAAYALAVQAVDVAWALLVLLGVERLSIDPTLASNPLVLAHMPYTHSGPATLLWMLAAALVGWRWAGRRAGLLLALAVGSHWVGDLLVHRPDLPLGWTGPKVGLALWDHPLVSWAVEVGLVLASAWWCARNGVVLRPRALLGLGVGLAILETVVRLGPLPTTPSGVAVAALAGYTLITLAARRAERVAGVPPHGEMT